MCTDCSIREYRSDFSTLCWHNVPAYYALNYAGIFDGGLNVINAYGTTCLSERKLKITQNEKYNMRMYNMRMKMRKNIWCYWMSETLLCYLTIFLYLLTFCSNSIPPGKPLR